MCQQALCLLGGVFQAFLEFATKAFVIVHQVGLDIVLHIHARNTLVEIVKVLGSHLQNCLKFCLESKLGIVGGILVPNTMVFSENDA
jgi:hypothetical protein